MTLTESKYESSDDAISLAAVLDATTPKQKTFKEQQRDNDVLYPEKKFPHAMPIPARMLHCALFRVADKRIPPLEKGVSKTVPLSSGGRIDYEGAELRQAEGAVFAYLCQLQAGKGLGQWLAFDPKHLIETLGWAKGTRKSIERLEACLTRLAKTTLEGYDRYGRRMWTTHLVLEWEHTKDGKVQAKLPEAMRHERWKDFSGTTHLDAKLLASFPEGLCSWLYGFTAANNGVVAYPVEALREYCGSEQADMKEFSKQLRKALANLVEAGAIQSGEVKEGKLSFKK